MPLVYTIEIKDQQVAQLVGELRKRLGNLEPLHKAWGLAWMGWADRNFRRGGSPRWRPLSPNTIVNRRKGGRGAQLLRDRGTLAQSAVFSATSRELRVGFSDEKAPWHHAGTKSYIIRPRRAKALHFFIAGARVVQVNVQTGKRSVMQRKREIFTREVHHPGLPARRLLPTRDQILTEMRIARIAQQYITLLKQGWDVSL